MNTAHFDSQGVSGVTLPALLLPVAAWAALGPSLKADMLALLRRSVLYRYVLIDNNFAIIAEVDLGRAEGFQMFRLWLESNDYPFERITDGLADPGPTDRDTDRAA